MSLSTGAGDADWRDAVKVGRTFGTTGPLLLLSVNDFGDTSLAETDHLGTGSAAQTFQPGGLKTQMLRSIPNQCCSMPD